MIQSLAWAAEDRTLDEAVVLQKAQKDAGQHPVHTCLVHGNVKEGLEGLGGAAGLLCRPPLDLDRRPPGAARVRLPQVGIQSTAQALEIGKEAGGVDHAGWS
jgi:hypothetical protein